MQDYYAILEVPQSAGQEEIKRSFKRLAVKWHPDKNPGNESAEDHFKRINEAYQVLSDPVRKARYDNMLLDNAYSKYSHSQSHSYNTPNQESQAGGRRAGSRPKYHKRPVNYKVDKEYFRIQKYVIGVFLFMVGAAYVAYFVRQSNRAEAERLKREIVQQTIDSLNQEISRNNYMQAFSRSILLTKRYPLIYEYYHIKDSISGLIRIKSEEDFHTRRYQEALDLYMAMKEHDTIQFDMSLDKVLKCMVELNMSDKAVGLLNEMMERNPTDMRLMILMAGLQFEDLKSAATAGIYIDKAKARFKEVNTAMFGEGFELVMDPKHAPDMYVDLFLLRARINLALGKMQEAYTDCNWILFFRPDLPIGYELRITAADRSGLVFRICDDISVLSGMGIDRFSNLLNKHCRGEAKSM